jgi:queuine tRNA-ribosyltransferase
MPPHPDMRFDLEKVDSSGARAGTLETSRGSISTPVFMPVATRGAIRALTLRELEEIDFDIILANTYHLYIRPGVDLLERAGGLHRFMNFHRPILTDSGGFQVFSLADLCRVRDNGVEFRSHLDGSLHFFSPTGVLDIQKVIGSDIMMVLDQCVEYPVDEAVARGAMGRTLDWAGISAAYWRERFDPGVQSLFAIVQGGVFPELRRECCERLVDLDLPGYAIGGLSVGEPRAIYQEITATRNGTIYTSGGRINIKAASLEYDFGPLDGQCSCYVCRNFSRSYLRHLFRMGEIAALVYNTYHNLFFMKQFMEDIRSSILNDSFASVYRRWESVFGKVRTSPEGEG